MTQEERIAKLNRDVEEIRRHIDAIMEWQNKFVPAVDANLTGIKHVISIVTRRVDEIGGR